MMPYKYQGLGAGPITPRRRAELIAFTIAMIAVYVAIAFLLAGCPGGPGGCPASDPNCTRPFNNPG